MRKTVKEKARFYAVSKDGDWYKLKDAYSEEKVIPLDIYWKAVYYLPIKAFSQCYGFPSGRRMMTGLSVFRAPADANVKLMKTLSPRIADPTSPFWWSAPVVFEGMMLMLKLQQFLPSRAKVLTIERLWCRDWGRRKRTTDDETWWHDWLMTSLMNFAGDGQ